MNINNLKENTTIKNYKELCSILEIKATTGATKQKQLEELKIYCDYERSGNKYIINKVIYNPTITIKDILKNKNNKYIEILSNIILEYLYNNPEELRDLPLIKLFSVLGITNINYKYANSYRKELSQLYNIHLASIYYFYDNTRNEYKKIIERCLNNLQKRSILFWSKCIIIVDKESKSFYRADEEMKKLILDTQKDILEELKVNSMIEIIKSKNKRKLFNDMIQKELSFNYFYAYDITVGDKAIKIEYDKLKENKDNINKLMIDKTCKMFDKNKYKHFKDDYNSLIDLLINSNTSEEIKDILVKQKDINFESYINDMINEELKHNQNLEDIKELYLDTYQL